MDSQHTNAVASLEEPGCRPGSTAEKDNAEPGTSVLAVPVSVSPASAADGDHGQDKVYLSGVRFFVVAALIGILIFLVSAETNITVTALVAITSDIGGFGKTSWILSSYQLGFVALIVISAKLSDIVGRKTVTVGLILIFTVFSGACAAAQTIDQLIVLRGLQGLGGGGCFTMSAILIVDFAPPEKYGKYVANAGIAIALGTVLGPVIGAAISEGTTWRWIFLFNVPVGVLTLGLALLGMPSGFPYARHGPAKADKVALRSLFARLDVPGSLLLLFAVLSFTACFQEAGSRFPWASAYVIVLLVVSAVLWVALLLWERRVTKAGELREPVLPWRFFTNRIMIGILVVILLVGGPMSVTTFQLPQRFQLVNGLSNLDSGLRLLPFGAMFPVGSMTGSTLASKLRVPAIYLALVGSVFQVVGYALLSALSASLQVEAKVYGYLILAGFGCGLTYTMVYIVVPFTVEKRDQAVGMAIANQFRTMGSAMFLAIATSVFNGYLGITGDNAADFAGVSEQQEESRRMLSEGYNRQMLVLCAVSAAQIPATLLLWKRKQIVPA
ncbi:Multidrug resistance protein 3 [Madurella mycetomatis]|uniref:Multidrug resistance protein 3 n=1 Tax=Madurella mycetomatis TaxID=100816 RepID=A0A175W9V0_9PEZI|nr:Multidrug resistance protein 3 [Madurella mycetomatis]